MSKYIVFERGEARAPKRDEWFEDLLGGICEAGDDFDRCFELQILRRLPDAEVEALEAKLASADTRARFERETAARLLPTIWARYEGKDSGWQQSAVAEACAMARMLADHYFGPAAGKGADGPTISDVLRVIARGGKVSDVGEAHVGRAKEMLERVAAALNQPIVERSPLPPTANPFTVYGPGACNPAPVPALKVGDRVGPWTEAELNTQDIVESAPPYVGKIAKITQMRPTDAIIDFGDGRLWCFERSILRPAPPEPWTPKRGDEVKIVASTLTPNSASTAMIGTHGKVLETYVDFRGKVARVGEYWFACSDLELVRGAEDVK
ncbi:MAG: hypothetical protein E6Q97_02350 [Desulfurellales bacterium]|nr:MAG: hypothetical protein E6Q97_02350 [Desulfurellales bacterium]